MIHVIICVNEFKSDHRKQRRSSDAALKHTKENGKFNRLLLCLFLATSASLGSLSGQDLSLKLVRKQFIEGFPSASSIVFFHNKFYVTGDDSKSILVLDGGYDPVDSIKLFNSPSLRISKDGKFDIESALALRGWIPQMVLFGSGASPQRERMLTVPFRHRIGKIKRYQPDFFERLRGSVGSLNIEGAVRLGSDVIFANRSTTEKPNQLVSMTFKSLFRENNDPVRLTALMLHDSIKSKIGVSDMAYVAPIDLLLLTLSSEETENALEDGPIGDSYIGWIADFDGKLRQRELRLDGLINLRMADARFQGEKIEGVCVEKISDGTITAHLVSDNDDGESTIFKVELRRIKKLEN